MLQEKWLNCEQLYCIYYAVNIYASAENKKETIYGFCSFKLRSSLYNLFSNETSFKLLWNFQTGNLFLNTLVWTTWHVIKPVRRYWFVEHKQLKNNCSLIIMVPVLKVDSLLSHWDTGWLSHRCFLVKCGLNAHRHTTEQQSVDQSTKSTHQTIHGQGNGRVGGRTDWPVFSSRIRLATLDLVPAFL